SYTMHDGSKALYFNWADLAVFDIYILGRRGAAEAYPENVRAEAARKHKSYSPSQLEHLSGTVMFGIPGEEKQTVEKMRANLDRYKDIDRAVLREHLKYFLQEVSPIAEEVGIKLAIHPDDPPFDILGLPRIVSTADDIDFILFKLAADLLADHVAHLSFIGGEIRFFAVAGGEG
ncbi:MAG: hypothetical protein EOP06_14515, partial [Proteobacteria bacterium]